jgi:NAD(P)-dependent dehydrogenase (short-subunit alcohol dehydrogenase family)
VTGSVTEPTTRSESWRAGDMPDLRGRHALVTGVTGGLGHETALALALAGARVTLAARDESRLRATAQTITDRATGTAPEPARLDTVQLDLADLSSVRRAADAVLGDTDRLDILVNNAGVMATPHRRTADGFELQFGTNHLGHFALTLLLMPVLADARVVTVTSLMHRTVRRVPLGDPRTPARYSRWQAYGASKLANLQFTLELDRRARAAGLALTSVAAHPGYAATHLQTSGPQLGGASLWARVMAAATPVLGQSAEMGALPTLYAATVPDLPGGTLVGPSRFLGARGGPTVAGMSGPARDPQAAARLWRLSEEATGVTFSA